MRKLTLLSLLALTTVLARDASVVAQEVVLPAPRLLTLMPMGGRVGATVEVKVTGENIDGARELRFSNPRIKAVPKPPASGQGEIDTFVVTIPADTPPGVYDARLVARLGVSSARAFSVGTLPEVTRTEPNTKLDSAFGLTPNSICNAVMTPRNVDYYRFAGKKGKRIVVECATRGIDSKLTPVLILADRNGRDLLVDRRGGLLDYKIPADGDYVIKVHGLTFQGGPAHFYRLVLMEDPPAGPPPRQPSTRSVSSFSWDPELVSGLPSSAETEPNNTAAQAGKITPPCVIDGSFFPAADVDTFEFTGKKGEVWWIEVASERLGLPTDPFVVVQKVTKSGGEEKVEDVAELNDIASPIKPSSNGYSYDGPVYDAGSADPLGKVEIKEDGIYRIQIRDLFGGTRSDARNVYRLIVRKPAPGFAVAAWALHMNLRNGDRNAVSKPISLRAGATMPLEVVAVRRDGFDGPIDLEMTDLPPGIKATGLRIPAGKTVGSLLITADENAEPVVGVGRIKGTAVIEGKTVTRPGRLASVVWPVRDASQEIPKPRLVDDVPVSVTRSESAAVTIAPAERKVWTVKAGDKLTIPLKVTWRSEFTGASIKLTPMGSDLRGAKPIDIPMKAAGSEVVLDLASAAPPPGEYALVLYGSAVAKYRYNPEAVKLAEAEKSKIEREAQAIDAEARKLAEQAKAAAPEKKSEAENVAKAVAGKRKAVEAAMVVVTRKMKAAADASAPKDIVDIVVAEPIRVLVVPKDKK